jgi:Mn-dependent DtxR family transcriptional regulator
MRRRRRKRGSNRRNKKRAFKGVLKRSDLFKNFKRREEDLLKYILKQDRNQISISKIKEEFDHDNRELESVMKRLQGKGCLIKEKGSVSLTVEGKEIAELVFRIHDEIEDYIKGRTLSCNAHQMAHILEHELTEEQIEKMKKASEFKDKGVSLPNFNLSSGKIVEVNLSECKVWTKMISIGIFPGQQMRILSRTPSNYLIEIKGSKFAIDSGLARGIYLIP